MTVILMLYKNRYQASVLFDAFGYECGIKLKSW